MSAIAGEPQQRIHFLQKGVYAGRPGADGWEAPLLGLRLTVAFSRVVQVSKRAGVVRQSGCDPQKLKATRVHDSRCQWFQAIFVMQPRQDRGCNDAVAIWDSVPIWWLEPAEQHVGNARTQAGVGSTLVVVVCENSTDGARRPRGSRT
jgi:hypothetical protein